LGIPLPMWLCPRSNTYETVEDGKFRFHVEIGHMLTGLIVRYRGWLVPVSSGLAETGGTAVTLQPLPGLTPGHDDAEHRNG